MRVTLRSLVVASTLWHLLPLPFVQGQTAQDITVNNDDWFYNVQECASTALDCWTVPSTYRISSDTEKVSPYTATRTGLSLSAARNEFEAFQVALKGVSADQTATVSLTDFVANTGGGSLGSATERRVEIHEVGYHSTENLADSLNRIPSDTTQFAISSSTSVAATILYVRVYVPVDAVPDDYTASLVIKDAGTGNTLVQIAVNLKVFDFALPVEATFKTQVNIGSSSLQPAFLSNAVDKLDWAKQFLMEYRMTPKDIAWPSGLRYNIIWDNSANGADQCNAINDEPYENLPYGAGENTRRWALGQGWNFRKWPVDANDVQCDGNSCPTSQRSTTGFSSDMMFQFVDNNTPRPSSFCGQSRGDNFGTAAYNAEWSAFLTGLDGYIQQSGNAGLGEKAYIYVQNEPQDDEDDRLANHLCNMYKTAAPNTKIAISEQAKANIAERTDGDGPCGYDIWIAYILDYDQTYAWDRLLNYGEETWFYNLPHDSGAYFSPAQGDVGVNDGMNIRVISWIAFMARIRGWAYYNMGIFFEGSAPRRPKMGAEIFRDSMEDYEYLFLANNGQHPMPYVNEAADPAAAQVGMSFTGWLRDHAKFAALRHELGRYIEGSRNTMPQLPTPAPPPANPVYINFGPASRGDVNFNGNTYTTLDWDFFDVQVGYGWTGDGFNPDGTRTTRLKSTYDQWRGDNELESTLLYNDYGRENTFQYAVADGTWEVTLAIGWPQRTYSANQDATVNGVVFNNGPIVGLQYFTQQVDVTDGYLTFVFGQTSNEYCFMSHFSALPVSVSNPSTSAPTTAPFAAPTTAPFAAPTTAPFAAPTTAPFAAPTTAPFDAPTTAPFDAPTTAPFDAPTTAPFDAPTTAPFDAPTTAPSAAPTTAPFAAPTTAPFDAPTTAPFDAPTTAPFDAPTTAPFAAPTTAPFNAPTTAPFDAPTTSPFAAPTTAPFDAPTTAPFAAPTTAPITGPVGSFVETMTVSDVSSALTTVQLPKTYSSPIVLCSPIGVDVVNPEVLYLQNVGPTSFEISLVEAGPAMDVQCLFVEGDPWVLATEDLHILTFNI